MSCRHKSTERLPTKATVHCSVGLKPGKCGIRGMRPLCGELCVVNRMQTSRRGVLIAACFLLVACVKTTVSWDCEPSWPRSRRPSPTRRSFSPAWSPRGWLILLSPCSVIQIWKVNNKLTSLRLYTGVTHSSAYRTWRNTRAGAISRSLHVYSIRGCWPMCFHAIGF